MYWRNNGNDSFTVTEQFNPYWEINSRQFMSTAFRSYISSNCLYNQEIGDTTTDRRRLYTMDVYRQLSEMILRLDMDSINFTGTMSTNYSSWLSRDLRNGYRYLYWHTSLQFLSAWIANTVQRYLSRVIHRQYAYTYGCCLILNITRHRLN